MLGNRCLVISNPVALVTAYSRAEIFYNVLKDTSEKTK
jgi:hypothetical protein